MGGGGSGHLELSPRNENRLQPPQAPAKATPPSWPPGLLASCLPSSCPQAPGGRQPFKAEAWAGSLGQANHRPGLRPQQGASVSPSACASSLCAARQGRKSRSVPGAGGAHGTTPGLPGRASKRETGQGDRGRREAPGLPGGLGEDRDRQGAALEIWGFCRPLFSPSPTFGAGEAPGRSSKSDQRLTQPRIPLPAAPREMPSGSP